jgi:hypothetical protein
MLESLRGRASERKLRLFACACCRRLWHRLGDPRSQEALETNERYADGLATDRELAWACGAARQAFFQSGSASADHPTDRSESNSSWAVWAALRQRRRTRSATQQAANSAEAWVEAAARTAGGWEWLENPKERGAQASLLRDTFGNPFRPLPAIATAWQTWNDGTVVRLAESAYRERHLPEGLLDKDRLAILADALEEAGCCDRQILRHLRGGTEHVRGCFVVDQLLDKE